MHISIFEGIFAQVYSGFVSIGSSFITKFAVLLNASPLHFSIMSAIAQLSQLFQLSGYLISRKAASRKPECVWFAFWGRLLNIFLFIPILIQPSMMSIIVFLSVLMISAALQNISGNMWTAWIADEIPVKIRGRFFSKRMQILMIYGFSTAWLISFFIDLFEKDKSFWKIKLISFFNAENLFKSSNQIWGIYLVILAGTLIGITGLYFLNKQPESFKKKSLKDSDHSILEPIKNPNFRKLILFNIWWMLAIGIGAPFWGPFMMKKLEMSLFEVQIYGALSSVSMLFAFKWWGKLIDKFGNRSMMKICVFLGGINPLIWVFFNKSSYFLIWPEAILSGFMWSGTNIISMNFILSISPKGKEQLWSAMYSAIGGLMMMTTMLLSGTFYPSQLRIFGLVLEPEQILFAITGLLRWTAEIPLQFVQEPSGVPFRRTIVIVKQMLFERFYKIRSRF